jgi:8-oxo-dGTP pyrophosphatase MutT (NUDIX family)
MRSLPIVDQAGNALVGFRAVAEEDLALLAEHLPASLVVVGHGDAVLMIFDSWRKLWELPGGKREAGETPRHTAARELHEETGIEGVDLTLVGVAEVDLADPPRRELLAIYRTRLDAAPTLTPNDEALDFLWWPPAHPLRDTMSPIDAEIARWVSRA